MHAVLEASAILHERVVHLVSLVDPCDRRQGTVHDRFIQSACRPSNPTRQVTPIERQRKRRRWNTDTRERQRQTVKRPGIGGC
jgi:hypothetical protein